MSLITKTGADTIYYNPKITRPVTGVYKVKPLSFHCHKINFHIIQYSSFNIDRLICARSWMPRFFSDIDLLLRSQVAILDNQIDISHDNCSRYFLQNVLVYPSQLGLKWDSFSVTFDLVSRLQGSS